MDEENKIDNETVDKQQDLLWRLFSGDMGSPNITIIENGQEVVENKEESEEQ